MMKTGTLLEWVRRVQLHPSILSIECMHLSIFRGISSFTIICLIFPANVQFLHLLTEISNKDTGRWWKVVLKTAIYFVLQLKIGKNYKVKYFGPQVFFICHSIKYQCMQWLRGLAFSFRQLLFALPKPICPQSFVSLLRKQHW